MVALPRAPTLRVMLKHDLTRLFRQPRLEPKRKKWVLMSCGLATHLSGDPNGIRTRVTPVKGECPRPLDDRVKGAVSIHYMHPRFKLYRKECSLPLTRRSVR